MVHSVTQLRQPSVQITFCLHHIPLVNSKAVFDNRCVRLQPLNGLDGAGEAAAVVGVKGDNGLTGEIYTSP